MRRVKQITQDTNSECHGMETLENKQEDINFPRYTNINSSIQNGKSQLHSKYTIMLSAFLLVSTYLQLTTNLYSN